MDLPLYWDAERAEIIRSKVREAIHDADEDNTEGVVLLGHSLGSVIAFDVLAEAVERGEDSPIKALVTMGSPLKWVTDLRESERELFPEKKIRTNIEPIRWVNFFDKEENSEKVGKTKILRRIFIFLDTTSSVLAVLFISFLFLFAKCLSKRSLLI